MKRWRVLAVALGLGFFACNLSPEPDLPSGAGPGGDQGTGGTAAGSGGKGAGVGTGGTAQPGAGGEFSETPPGGAAGQAGAGGE